MSAKGFCWMLLPSKDVYSCTRIFWREARICFWMFWLVDQKFAFDFKPEAATNKEATRGRVVDEVEKSSLLSGLVVNFEFPKGVMSNVYDQQWVVFSSRYFVVVAGFWKHVHLVSWYKTAGIFTCTGTHFFPRKIGRWWQVIFEMNTQNREPLLTFKLKEHWQTLAYRFLP